MKTSCNLCENDGFSVEEIAQNLEPNTYTAVQCKYCGIVSIGKTSNFEVKLAIINGKITLESIPVKWLDLDDYLENHIKIKKEYESNLHHYWRN